MQNASGRMRYGERADKSQFLSLCGLDSYLLLFYKICLSGVDTLMVTVHRPYSAKSKLHENAILRDLQAPKCIENAFCVHREACYCERSEQ